MASPSAGSMFVAVGVGGAAVAVEAICLPGRRASSPAAVKPVLTRPPKSFASRATSVTFFCNVSCEGTQIPWLATCHRATFCTPHTFGQSIRTRPKWPGERWRTRVAGWITADPDNVAEEHRLVLKSVLAHRPQLDALTRHVRTFADMLPTPRRTTCPRLHSFAADLRRNLPAVTAGLTLPWNSGVVEGHVGESNDQTLHVLPPRSRRLRKRVLQQPAHRTCARATMMDTTSPDPEVQSRQMPEQLVARVCDDLVAQAQS